MAFARVCGCVLAVFFALPFAAEKANAQAAECAQFDVFTPSSGTWQATAIATHNADISGTLAAIVARFTALPVASPGSFFALRLAPGESRITAEPNIPVDNIPLFSVSGTDRQPNAGEFFLILDFNALAAVANDQEFRLYADTVGGDLRLANLPTAKKCAAALTGTEFFLHSTDYTPYSLTATPSATTYLGYVEPNCEANNMFDDGTGLGCRDAMNDEDCKMLNPLHVFDADMGICRPTESSDCTTASGTPYFDDVAGICVADCPLARPENDGEMSVCRVATATPPIDCTGMGDLVANTAGDACECPMGMRLQSGETEMCEPIPQTQPAAAADESDDEGFPAEDALIAYGGVFGVVLAAHFLWDGNPNAFAFSPDVGYSLTESGYSFNAGGRMDFHKDRWHLYWTAGQESVNGDFGDFRYSSGGSYAADFWTATFSENASGEIVDYDISLSANYGEGVWKLSPVYRLHSRFEESETGRMESETTNSLNLEGILRANRWILRPSAGFQWRGMDDFADNAKFGFSAVRNL